MIIVLYKYILTAKLAHGLHHDVTVVDYNLIIKFFNIGDVKHPAHTRLQKIETHSCLVIKDKHKQVIRIFSVVYLCASPYKGHQLAISQLGASIYNLPHLCSNLNHFSCISHCEQMCFDLAPIIKLIELEN